MMKGRQRQRLRKYEAEIKKLRQRYPVPQADAARIQTLKTRIAVLRYANEVCR